MGLVRPVSIRRLQPVRLIARAGLTHRVLVLRGLILAILLVSWELVGRRYPLLVSYPTQVLAVYPRLIAEQNLQQHLLYSIRTLLLAYGMAAVIGIVTGMALGRSRLLGSMVEPYIHALYATPRVALVPLIVLWFGIGYQSVVFTVVLLAVFPILLATLSGARNVDAAYLDVARAFRVPRLQVLVKVILPGVLPYLVTGLRLGAGRAVTGLIVGEMFIRESGLGYLLYLTEIGLVVGEMFALILLVGIIGAMFPLGFKRLEQRLASWQPQQQDGW